MKLKNLLLLAFLTLTMIPIVLVSLLLYKSGLDLSKESYTRNLTESINVQADYISQTIENKMISDQRFVDRSYSVLSDDTIDLQERKSNLLQSVQSYLDFSEDEISVCMLLDQANESIYSIGEKSVCDAVISQLDGVSEPAAAAQHVMEFELSSGVYSLGIVTPAYAQDGSHLGSMVSVYEKNFLFKIISSYYEISDTSTLICRQNGEIVSFRGNTDEIQSETVQTLVFDTGLNTEGSIGGTAGSEVNGYYRNVRNAPWYLVGLINRVQIYSFTNQFVFVYILIIGLVVVADILLSIGFSRKVVEPINGLIRVMEGYKNNMQDSEPGCGGRNGYYETSYLHAKFRELMKAIMLVQHNFEGVYRLYQSGAMDDTNIDIDVKRQILSCNKTYFQDYMQNLVLPPEACIVERFTRCFCDSDQKMLMEMFERMRDEHLAGTREAQAYAPGMHERWFHAVVVPMYEDDRLSRLFIQLRDISGYKRQELESSEQARKDPLTGLYNRFGFALCAQESLSSPDNAQMHALLFMDMNYFKLVNDTLGHAAGDELLRTVAGDLLYIVGNAGIVSRFGGDEFAVFLPDTTKEAVERTVEELNRKLVYPYKTEIQSFTISVSIGVSAWTHTTPDTFDKLMEQADAAMYRAKRKFKRALTL